MSVEQISPPGFDADVITPTQHRAPVPHDRGSSYNPQSRLAETPYDPLTLLSLPLMPVENPHRMYRPDWHHHEHPKRSPLLKEIGGQAVRNARLQYYDRRLHNRYHDKFGGPPLPETEEQQFNLVIMAVAGYIPEQAIDVRRRKPQIVALTTEQRHRLQTSGEIRVGSEAVLREFIKKRVMSQDVYSVNASDLMIEEFVTTNNFERRRLLGHTLLGLVTDKASEVAGETYWQARRKELILPGLPSNVQRFAKSKLGNTRERDRLVKQLYKSLAVAA